MLTDIYAKYKRWVLKGCRLAEALKLVEKVAKYNRREKVKGHDVPLITQRMIRGDLQRAFGKACSRIIKKNRFFAELGLWPNWAIFVVIQMKPTDIIMVNGGTAKRGGG